MTTATMAALTEDEQIALAQIATYLPMVHPDHPPLYAYVESLMVERLEKVIADLQLADGERDDLDTAVGTLLGETVEQGAELKQLRQEHTAVLAVAGVFLARARHCRRDGLESRAETWTQASRLLTEVLSTLEHPSNPRSGG
jgi:hypothetical protein